MIQKWRSPVSVGIFIEWWEEVIWSQFLILVFTAFSNWDKMDFLFRKTLILLVPRPKFLSTGTSMNPAEESPNMKGILFLRFPTASLVQAQIDEEIIESGEDIHGIFINSV